MRFTDDLYSVAMIYAWVHSDFVENDNSSFLCSLIECFDRGRDITRSYDVGLRFNGKLYHPCMEDIRHEGNDQIRRCNGVSKLIVVCAYVQADRFGTLEIANQFLGSFEGAACYILSAPVH